MGGLEGWLGESRGGGPEGLNYEGCGPGRGGDVDRGGSEGGGGGHAVIVDGGEVDCASEAVDGREGKGYAGSGRAREDGDCGCLVDARGDGEVGLGA